MPFPSKRIWDVRLDHAAVSACGRRWQGGAVHGATAPQERTSRAALFFVTAESACFFLGSEKTKQLFCFRLSEEELDSCRTSAVVEKHLICFSFTAQLCCVAEKGKDQAEWERIFTICWPGSLFYSFFLAKKSDSWA